MGLKGKLVSEIKVKWEGDLFQMFQFPSEIPQLTPHLIQNVELLAGRWGTAASVIRWTYCHDGVTCMSKDIIETIDEKKKLITFKVLEGDPIKLFSAFKIIVKVENIDGVDNMLTWTLEYEKQSEDVADPTAFMNFLLNFSKDVDRSRYLVPN